MQYENLINKKIIISFLFLFLFFSVNPLFLNAQSVSELESQISNYEAQIQKLEREIAEQRKKVMDTSQKAAELEGVVNSLNATQKKLDTEIEKTQNVIGKSSLNVQKIAIEIDDKKNKINITNKALSQAIRRLNVLEERTFFEMLFSSDTLSQFTNDVINMETVKNNLRHTKEELTELNKELSYKKDEEEVAIKTLSEEKKKLEGQKETVAYTKKEKDSLLALTKNEQSKYETLLAQKEAEKKAFEKEMYEIESKLKVLIDPSSFPDPRKGILAWPLDNFVITQLFGGTQFAKRNPHIYTTGSHNGVDLAVPIGTPVKTVESGTIMGFDNTDKYPGCRSWGGWVLVKHDNGLSTLYAHLSSNIVSVGQRVEKGQVIAYSGNTGISTGPHLHFTVYISQGVTVRYYKDIKPSATGCGATNAQIPIASLDSYLDPMLYLPAR